MLSTEKLKTLRKQKGWTQEQLANISGVSTRTIQRIEQSGECSQESQMAIASAFDINPNGLLIIKHKPSTTNRLVYWSILLITIATLLLIQGGGEIKERLHINAILMSMAFFTLSLRTLTSKDFIALLKLSILGIQQPRLSVTQSIRGLNQLIKHVYISAAFAFVFHAWSMSHQKPFVSIFSTHFMEVMADGLIACALYSLLVAEFGFRSAKTKLELYLQEQV